MRGHGLAKGTEALEKQAPKKVRKEKHSNKPKLGIKKVLNIGWGGVPIQLENDPGYKTEIYNLDQLDYYSKEDKNLKTHYVTDAKTLKGVEDNNFNAIYAGHILEHFHTFELEEVLKNWLRVLIPGGGAMIEVPNGPWVLQHMEGDLNKTLYMTPNGFPITALDMIYGFQHDIQKGLKGMEHKNLFDSTSLYNTLKKAGFVKIEVSLKEEFRGSLVAKAFKPTRTDSSLLIAEISKKEKDKKKDD